MNNPWTEMPEKYPYVLPLDKEEVDVYNRNIDVAEQDKKILDWLIAEPYLGDPNAPLYILARSPHVSDNEREDMGLHNSSKHKEFQTAMKNNLKHENDPEWPLYFLKDEYADTAIAKYWSTVLADLIEEFGKQYIAQNVFIVQYFPYHIQNYAYTLLVPSQKYGFELVYDAAKSGKTIVAQYSLKKWLKDVKILRTYENALDSKGAQASNFTPKSLTKAIYDQVVDVLKAAKDVEKVTPEVATEETPSEEVAQEVEATVDVEETKSEE